MDGHGIRTKAGENIPEPPQGREQDSYRKTLARLMADYRAWWNLPREGGPHSGRSRLRKAHG